MTVVVRKEAGCEDRNNLRLTQIWGTRAAVSSPTSSSCQLKDVMDGSAWKVIVNTHEKYPGSVC